MMTLSTRPSPRSSGSSVSSAVTLRHDARVGGVRRGARDVARRETRVERRREGRGGAAPGSRRAASFPRVSLAPARAPAPRGGHPRGRVRVRRGGGGAARARGAPRLGASQTPRRDALRRARVARAGRGRPPPDPDGSRRRRVGGARLRPPPRPTRGRRRRRPHRLRRGPLRPRRSHRLPRVLRPPRRQARRPRPRPRPRSATGRHILPSSGSLGVFLPAATPAESAAESARRVDAEARARPGGRVQPPKWAPPDDHPTFARFTFSELFAGVGGFGAALRDLGGEATFASESCPHARRTYVVNHGCGAGTGAPGDGPLVVGDITDVCEEIIPPHDVLTGGFPCQSFSARGQRRGLDDPRGALYREILRTLVACRPRAFLLENVEGLATMDDGEVLDVIVADLRAAGYDVETKIIDAAGWVPQSRKRGIFRRLPRRRGKTTKTFGDRGRPRRTRAPRADRGRARRVGFVGRRGRGRAAGR